MYFSFLFQSSGSTKINFKSAKIGAKNLKYLYWVDSEQHTYWQLRYEQMGLLDPKTEKNNNNNNKEKQ